MPYTILHPAAFMEPWAMIVGEPIAGTGRATIFGPGTTPFNLVAVDNVADVAVLTLDRPDALNATVEIAGPQNLTLLEVVEIFERVTGRKARRSHVPLAVMRLAAAVLRPFSPVLARQVRLGLISATTPQEADPGPMLSRYPVRLIALEEWVRGHIEKGRLPVAAT